MFGKVLLTNKKEYELINLKNEELIVNTQDFDFATPLQGKFMLEGFTNYIDFTGFVSKKEKKEIKIKFIVEKNNELMLKGAEAYTKAYYKGD